jgi:hypothetical protein
MKQGAQQLSDIEISRSLRLEAVRRGLRNPETPDEVAEFEKEFCEEIASETRDCPPLEQVLARADQLRTSGMSVAGVDIKNSDYIE